PEATPALLRYVRTIACRAAALAMEAPAGVVHLNFPFRDPLVPVPAGGPAPADGRAPADQAAFAGRPNGQPFIQATSEPRAAQPAVLARLAAELAPVQRGLIVAGPQADPAFPEAVAGLSAALGYPILADPLSLVRCGPHDRQGVIDAYDAFLRD